MAAANKKTNTAQAVNTTPAQEPEINEVDGEPIFHADEEEGIVLLAELSDRQELRLFGFGCH